MNSPTLAGGFTPSGVVNGSIASEPTLGAGGGEIGSTLGEGVLGFQDGNGHDIILGG